jgi:hypothetical protein
LLSFAGLALAGCSFSLSVVTSDSFANSSVSGFVVASALVIAAIGAAWFISVVVGRLRLAIDFSFTLYLFFVVVCWSSSRRLPSLTWWILVLSCFGITAALSERLCVLREMREIAVSDSPSRTQRSRGAQGSLPLTTARSDSRNPSPVSALNKSIDMSASVDEKRTWLTSTPRRSSRVHSGQSAAGTVLLPSADSSSFSSLHSDASLSDYSQPPRRVLPVSRPVHQTGGTVPSADFSSSAYFLGMQSPLSFVTAHSSGTITRRGASSGQAVSASTELLRTASGSRLPLQVVRLQGMTDSAGSTGGSKSGSAGSDLCLQADIDGTVRFDMQAAPSSKHQHAGQAGSGVCAPPSFQAHSVKPGSSGESATPSGKTSKVRPAQGGLFAWGGALLRQFL